MSRKKQLKSRQSSDSSRNKNISRTWREPRQVDHYWSFYKKGLYVTKRTSGLPAWLLPLLVMILIIALVFWAAPMIVARMQAGWKLGQDAKQTTLPTQYSDETAVVLKPVADVFDKPDIKADRLTQVLFNEPVQLLQGADMPGFRAVRLHDGLNGYMMADDLTMERTSVEPATFIYKAVVVNGSKRVMSHARQGALIVEVMMGTELYIDYRGAGVSRVALPGGTSGWISDDGVVILPADGELQQPHDLRQAFCNTALSFPQVTYLENGQTIRGISPAGITRLSAKVNGLQVPRTLSGLEKAGKPVPFMISKTEGLPDLTTLLPGDLMIIADSMIQKEAAGLAIYLGEGQMIFARPEQTTIRLMNLAENKDIWQRILVVRRLFP